MNQFAQQIVAESVVDTEKTPASARTPGRRAGGIKSGRARAEKLIPEERSAIARKAAAARWGPGAVSFRRDRKTDDD